MSNDDFIFGIYTALFISFGLLLLIIELFGVSVTFFDPEFYRIIEGGCLAGAVGIVYEAWKTRFKNVEHEEEERT